ncbi:PREDICTED: uncharacterized protein LOC101295119 [Fragaria vesca subsp. vesca]
MFEAAEHSLHSKRPHLSLCSNSKQTPHETMIEEIEALMISPSGGHPFHKTAHFLKPISPSSLHEIKLPTFFSSLPSHFNPTKWNLKVEFPGWQHGQKEWKDWVKKMAPLHRSTWKKAGIYEAILNSTYQIKRDNDLVYGLAEKWCSETNTFIFPWGEATVTLEDVMVLGGFPVLGDSIFRPLQSREMREVKEKLEKERSAVIKSTGNAKTSAWLSKFINNGSALEHEAFLAYWLSRIADLRKTRSSDDTIKLILKSPLHFVQVWAWERVLELSPFANVVRNVEPRLARWDKVNGVGVEDLREILDTAGEGFMWRPYVLATEKSNLPKFYLEKDKWVGPYLDDEFLAFALCLKVTDLVGFGTTEQFGTKEQYLPHRVARQFGYDQDIPSFVAQTDDDSDILHGKENPHIAWKGNIKEIKKLKLYIPSRLSEADVSTSYMQWWGATVSELKHISERTMPQKKKGKSVGGSMLKDKNSPIRPGFRLKKVFEGSKERITDFTILSVSNARNEGNDSLFPPGFSPRSNTVEAGDPTDEVELTVSATLEKRKKHIVETRKRDVDSIPEESSADTLIPERMQKEDMLNSPLVCGCKVEKNLKHVMGSDVSSPDNDLVSIVGNDWGSRVEKQVSELKNIVRSLERSEVLKYCKKQKIMATGIGGDSVKLSGVVQNLVYSLLQEGSVHSMHSERFEKEAMVSEDEALIGGSRANTNLENFKGINAGCPDNHTGNAFSSCSSSFEKLHSSKECQKNFSELQARIAILENVVGVSQENTDGAGFRNC